MLYLVFVHVLALGMVIGVARWAVGRLCCNLARWKVWAVALAVSGLLCGAVDFATVTHWDRTIFAMPLWSAGDGGSTYYVGPLYHIYQGAVYGPGGLEDLAFFCRITPWFFPVVS